VIWTQISEELGGGVDKTIKGQGERTGGERAMLESRNRLAKHEWGFIFKNNHKNFTSTVANTGKLN
jgi:hypothetical protein